MGFMNLKQAALLTLADDAEVAVLVSDRIYPNPPPEGAGVRNGKFRDAILTVESRKQFTDHVTDGPSGLKKFTLTITGLALTRSLCDQLSAAVESVFDGYNDTITSGLDQIEIQNAKLRDDSEDFEAEIEGGDDVVYGTTQNFDVWAG